MNMPPEENKAIVRRCVQEICSKGNFAAYELGDYFQQFKGQFSCIWGSYPIYLQEGMI